MIIPPSTPHTESYTGPQSPTQPSAAVVSASFSFPCMENIHLNPQKNPRQGVALSNRILMGNKEACLTLQSIVPLGATDLRKQIEELIRLIDRSRSFAPMSDAEYSRKVNLQSLIAESVQRSVFQK